MLERSDYSLIQCVRIQADQVWRWQWRWLANEGDIELFRFSIPPRDVLPFGVDVEGFDGIFMRI